MSTSGGFVGIDVSKMQLDLAIHATGRPWQVAYDSVGLKQVVKHLRTLAPTLIVLEATGGLETRVVSALAAAQMPVVVVNPRQVRAFAQATGTLAKTDRLDAQVLAHFAAVMPPTPRPLPDAATQQLSAVLTRRQQLVDMITAESNRLASQLNSALRKRVRVQKLSQCPRTDTVLSGEVNSVRRFDCTQCRMISQGRCGVKQVR